MCVCVCLCVCAYIRVCVCVHLYLCVSSVLLRVCEGGRQMGSGVFERVSVTLGSSVKQEVNDSLGMCLSDVLPEIDLLVTQW